MKRSRGVLGLFDKVLDWAQENPKQAIVTSFVLATVAAVVDYRLDDRFPVIICYLPAVMLACWVTNVAVGTTLAAICCTGWLVDDILQIGDAKLTVDDCWTAIAHGGFYAVIIGMLHRLRLAYDTERRLARTDGLTGLLNAKAFRERADDEIVRAERTRRPVTVAFIDCDNFKTVNDTLGHLEGDRLLAAIADQMRKTVRATDLPARMGGDEFAILLPETSEEEARNVVERLRTDLGLRMKENDWPVTFSIGVAVYASPPATVDALLRGADMLMYEVKNGQKDAVILKLVA